MNVGKLQQKVWDSLYTEEETDDIESFGRENDLREYINTIVASTVEIVKETHNVVS